MVRDMTSNLTIVFSFYSTKSVILDKIIFLTNVSLNANFPWLKSIWVSLTNILAFDWIFSQSIHNHIRLGLLQQLLILLKHLLKLLCKDIISDVISGLYCEIISLILRTAKNSNWFWFCEYILRGNQGLEYFEF